MNNAVKNLKKRLRAPRDLVEATKRGERFVPAYKPDTRAIHIRRFSKALVAYACAAVLLVGVMAVFPSVLNDKGSPVSKPSSNSTVLGEPKSDYVYLPEELAANYVRPDLIWGNELNPGLKEVILWSTDMIDSQPVVTQPMEIPKIGSKGAQFAVEICIEAMENGSEGLAKNYLNRQFEIIKKDLQNVGFEAVEFKTENDDRKLYSAVCAVSREALEALDTDAIAMKLKDANGNLRIVLRVAWQSCPTEALGG